MKFSQVIKPISYFKAHAADVIRELNEHHGTMIIRITTKSATAERRPLECLVGQASNLVTVHCQGLTLGVCSSFNYSPHIWRGPR